MGSSLGKALQKRGRTLVTRQERQVAADVGGKVQPGSGNQWHAKGDAKSAELLVECKSTRARSFSVQADVLDKIENEAILQGRMAVLQVEFHGKARHQKYAMIPWDWFLQLTEEGGMK